MKTAIQFVLSLALMMGITARVEGASPTGDVQTVGGSFTPGYVDGDNSVSLFNSPYGLYLNGTQVLIADFGNNVIRALDQSNVASTFTRNAIDGPTDITVDPEGRVYVANLNSGTVVRYGPAGNTLGIFISGLASPTAIALDGEGNFLVAQLAGQVRRYDPDGVLLNTYSVTAGFAQLRGIIPYGDSIIVSDAGNHVLWEFPADGGVAALFAGTLRTPGFAEGGPSIGRFNAPHGLGVTTNGIVVVADRFNHRVRAVTADGVISTLYGVDPATWQGLPEDLLPGWTDGTPAEAELREPYGIAVAANSGEVWDTEVHYGIIRRVTGLTFPTNVVLLPPITNSLSPSGGVFPNGVTVTVSNSGDLVGGFPPNARVFYTLDGSIPGPENPRSALATISGTTATIQLPGPVNLQDLKVRTFNGNTAGPVAQGVSVDIGVPEFGPKFGFFPNGVTLWVTNASSPSGLFAPGTQLYYTTNGTDPTLASFLGTILPSGIGQIIITNAVNLADVRVRAFVGATGGTVVSGSPAPPSPNRISLGFENGEASSDFFGAGGQKFYAPITLTVPSGQTMYGLQLNLMFTNLPPTPAPATYSPSFFSTLLKILPNGTFATILPEAVRGFSTTTVTQAVVTAGVTNLVITTNINPLFAPLVVANASGSFLGVGWIERATFTNLYDTTKQDLIQYSQAHDNLFLRGNGKVVVGAFGVRIPTSAAIGNQYQVKIGRPSATGDGVASDVVIDTPQDGDQQTNLRATRTLNIQTRAYLVGDVAPFRWFNAGDFGDTNILNNDLTQLHQSFAYGVNLPPFDSDMFDALDSCCQDINHVELSSTLNSFQGDDTATLNRIAYGDGVLTLEDLYVTFRRSLDPSLTNYIRFWSNGVLRAVAAANTSWRGVLGAAGAVSADKPKKAPADLAAAADPASVKFSMESLRVTAGSVAKVPITVEVFGPYSVRSILLRLSVYSRDNVTELTAPVSFVPDPSISGPTLNGSKGPNGVSVAWLDTPTPLSAGVTRLGTLSIAIPPGATPDSVFEVKIEHAEASAGVGRFAVEASNALVLMSTRAYAPWTDEIPDAWRIQYFGSAMNILSAPEADADGDGVNNLTEYRTGTNPTDILSRFTLRGESAAGETSFILSWPTMTGKSYRLESSDALSGNDWSLVEDNILGTGAQVQRLRPRDAKARFYRVFINQ